MSDRALAAVGLPEHNVTGHDYAARAHLHFGGPIIDVHAHVFQTRLGDPADGPPLGKGPDASMEQAEAMLTVAREFGIVRTYSMCPPDDIEPLRERFGAQLGFNGSIMKKLDDPEDAAYRLLDRFLSAGVEMIKFWSAPRGRDRGLFVNTPWRKEAARRAIRAGIRAIMVHVADPEVWFQKTYADRAKFGTKADCYRDFEEMLAEFPDVSWIGAHMGGDPEHPDHLEELLERYPHLYYDTSATKWQVREVSARHQAVRELVCRKPTRFLFGTDLVTRHRLQREHYVSRYWCQRTLWESQWQGQSPIADPDFTPAAGGPATPRLCGVGLPKDALKLVYRDNAIRLIPNCANT